MTVNALFDGSSLPLFSKYSMLYSYKCYRNKAVLAYDGSTQHNHAFPLLPWNKIPRNDEQNITPRVIHYS